MSLILIFGLLCCSRSKVENAFESIDYSCFYGVSNSLKISSDGKTYISKFYNHPDRVENLSLKLTSIQVDSLAKMIKVLSEIKLDTLFIAPMADHPISFALIIKTKDQNQMISYRGDLNEIEFRQLFILHEYLNHLINKAINKSDTIMAFKSKSRLILPPISGQL